MSTVTVIRLAGLRSAPLSVDEVLAAVQDPSAGATAVFIGTVRDHDGGKGVTTLAYSAHPTALAELERIAEKVAASHQLRGLAVLHRTGDLTVGDLAVVVAASADHRDAAFSACRSLIEELKASVPIWKHQIFASGDSEWVHSA